MEKLETRDYQSKIKSYKTTHTIIQSNHTDLKFNQSYKITKTKRERVSNATHEISQARHPIPRPMAVMLNPLDHLYLNPKILKGLSL